MVKEDDERLVGSDRVLAVLIELAEHPTGVTLDELAIQLDSAKSTVHRALASLRRARLATQIGRGRYVLGDEFIRLAFTNQAARPEGILIEPVLRELVEEFGETVHYAVLEGNEVVYRAKLDPPKGGIRLTSMIGGRNPAYRTAVGKLLLSQHVTSIDELRRLVGDGPYDALTPNTITTVEALWSELEVTRARGFGVDNQENELGVNCVAVPVALDERLLPAGAVSVSALAFRIPMDQLMRRASAIRSIVDKISGGYSQNVYDGTPISA